MFDVNYVFMNSLIDGATHISNVGSPTWTWDYTNTFIEFRVHKVFGRSKGALNGVKWFKDGLEFILFKNVGNLVHGFEDEGKMNLGNRLIGFLS